jgi:hypothetical protein
MKKIVVLLVLLSILLTACSQVQEESFDSQSKDWEGPVIVSSQDPSVVFVNFDDGMLNFDLKSKESYVYEILTGKTYQDVKIQAEVKNKGMLVNGISLLCRVNKDKTSWYEFRVSSGGEYQFFLYDKSLKDAGKNPYKELVKRGINDAIKPDKTNLAVATCEGTKFTLTVNGTSIFEKENGDLGEAGYVGLGAVSYDTVPVQIGFANMDVAQP